MSNHSRKTVERAIHAKRKRSLSSAQIHGMELPGHWSAFADSVKDTSLLLLIIFPIFAALQAPYSPTFWAIIVFALSWLIWKTGRCAIRSYARLERMHRIIEEERWEIEHHPQQEREELRAFYEAKGFSGPLLEEVVEMLMADDNRLLEVMLKEELGFSLDAMEHPLKQAVGAAFGSFFTILAISISFWTLPYYGSIVFAVILIAAASAIAAYLERNRMIRSIGWNVSAALLAFATATYALQLMLSV